MMDDTIGKSAQNGSVTNQPGKKNIICRYEKTTPQKNFQKATKYTKGYPPDLPIFFVVRDWHRETRAISFDKTF